MAACRCCGHSDTALLDFCLRESIFAKSSIWYLLSLFSLGQIELFLSLEAQGVPGPRAWASNAN